MHNINNDSWFKSMEKEKKCKYLSTQQDRNGETVISFCGHPCNPEDTERNCRIEICPIAENSEEHY